MYSPSSGRCLQHSMLSTGFPSGDSTSRMQAGVSEADALETGLDVQYGGFMPVEQPCRTDFAQRFGCYPHALKLLPVHLFHAPAGGLLRSAPPDCCCACCKLCTYCSVSRRYSSSKAELLSGCLNRPTSSWRRQASPPEGDRSGRSDGRSNCRFHVREERFEYRHVAVYPHELIRRLCPCQRSGLESPFGFDVLHHVRGVAFGGVGHHQYLVFQIFQFLSIK